MLPLELEKLIDTLFRTPEDKRPLAIANLSKEETQAIYESDTKYFLPPQGINASNAPRTIGMSMKKAQALMREDHERNKRMNSCEMLLDHIMTQNASTVPSADIFTIQQCREFSGQQSAHILESWNSLHMILACHEELIRKRWMRMSRNQREELLLTAWPGMSSRHRPDMDWDAASKHLLRETGTQTRAISAAAWPYINLEDLLEPKALLLFINSRGRNTPDQFAYADLELAPVYKYGKELLALRQENYTMAFIGRSSSQIYGEVVSWDSGSEALTSIKTGRAVHIDHGCPILEIQDGIWSFLCRCVGLILRSSPVPPVGSIAPDEPPPLANNEGPLTSLCIIARESPYRLPSQLDLPRLQALVSAQKHLAIDHAIALRVATDFPMYNKAQRQLTADAHCAVFIWHEIQTRMAKINQMSIRYTREISVEKDLPADYFEALAELRFFLERISLDLIDIVNAEYRPSPPLRGSHFRETATYNVGYYIQLLPGICARDPVLDCVLNLLLMLTDRGFRDLFSLHVILDELERLMQANAQAKALITPHLASSLSQLSIVSECLHQLHLFQPWAQKIESTIQEQRPRYLAEYDTLFRKWGAINQIYGQFNTPQLFKVGNPKDGKFYYPADKRRTRGTVNAMRSAEAALDTFWTAANAHFRRYIGTTPVALVKHIIGERPLQRTAPWVEPPKAMPRIRLRDQVATGLVSSFDYSHDPSKQITGSFNKLAVSSKDKKKTRGLGDRNEAAMARAVAIEEAVSRAPTIAVGKRAQKVFNSLFHTSESPDQPGGVAWPDFLHAMVKAGFGAEKLQGSAWHFTPHNIDVGRSIQFHEPHPSNKLPFTWARCYGRRLTRAFGWTRESFTVA